MNDSRPLRILAVNAGSTSLKLERYDLATPLSEIAAPPEPVARQDTTAEHAEDVLAELLRDGVDRVAHRLVRVPDDMPSVWRLDDDAERRITEVGRDAPLHDAEALRAVGMIRKIRPGLAQFAVADSAFHRTMPAEAVTYAIPRRFTEAGLRRIGYHGLSHEYAAHRGCALAGLDVRASRVIVAHLGGGSSLCAVRNGESVETSMGYTPLDGLPMATRSGSVDPGLLLHLLRRGMSLDELDHMLEHESGLAGMSGMSGDLRELEAAGADAGARLAIGVLGWRIRAALGAYVATLGGLDLVVFTGGIGEHAAALRAAALDGGLGLGAAIDSARNGTVVEGCIEAQGAGSGVRVCVVTAREGWQLARKSAGVGDGVSENDFERRRKLQAADTFCRSVLDA